jgi:hypothetical protein
MNFKLDGNIKESLNEYLIYLTNSDINYLLPSSKN